MNNKGFAVSSVLYTILICFLMFLGAAMAMFSSSNSLVVAANDDIINGTKFDAKKVEIKDDSGKLISDIEIKISSRYGSAYYPRNFNESCDKEFKNIKCKILGENICFYDSILNKDGNCSTGKTNTYFVIEKN